MSDRMQDAGRPSERAVRVMGSNLCADVCQEKTGIFTQSVRKHCMSHGEQTNKQTKRVSSSVTIFQHDFTFVYSSDRL